MHIHGPHELLLDLKRNFGEECENWRIKANRAIGIDDHSGKLMCRNSRPVRGVHRSKHLSYSVCHHPPLNATLSGSLLLYSSELLSKQEWRLSWSNPNGRASCRGKRVSVRVDFG